jgi:hypothetical protein
LTSAFVADIFAIFSILFSYIEYTEVALKIQSQQTRMARYRTGIKSLVLSRLSAEQMRLFRKRYQEESITIADLAEQMEIPPVVMWSALTPLNEKSVIKHKMLTLESKIYDLLAMAVPEEQIRKELAITEEELKQYTTDRFSEKMYHLRPWYNSRVLLESEDEEKWEEKMEGRLPPTSRIGWTSGELRAIEPERLGRCETCGRMVHLPCYACAVEEYVRKNNVPQAEEIQAEEEVVESSANLLFR